MSNKPGYMTRRKFLLQLSALTPLAATIMVRGNIFNGLALAQGTAVPTTAPTMAATALDCVASPSMTEGPYFVDELLKRIDIRTDPTDNSVKPGVPLQLEFHLFSVNGSTCAPLKGAQIDIWHCDAAGLYSDEAANNTRGKKFLRGYQLTDDSGVVKFQTIYPGWYRGRTVHIHVKVRTFSADGTQSYAFNTQLFFDDKLSDQVYTQAPYSGHGQRDTTNATDMVFNDSDTGAVDPHDLGEKMLLTLTSTSDNGYATIMYIGVDLSKPFASSGGGPGGGQPFGGPGGAPPNGGGFGPPPNGTPPATSALSS